MIERIVDGALVAFSWGMGLGAAYFAIWAIREWVKEGLREIAIARTF